MRTNTALRLPVKPVKTGHTVRCWHCGQDFDLIAAVWCGCGASVKRPSKRCPHCLECICSHPDYENEALWGEAPRYLKERGFSKLFYLYL